MVLISTGLAGFASLAMADMLQIALSSRKSGALKALEAVARFAGYSFNAAALCLLALAPSSRWPFSSSEPLALAPLSALGGIIAAALFSGLMWTVFGELAIARKNPGFKGGVVASGSYARCRHPGFWWYATLAVFVALARQEARLLAPALFLTAADFALVAFQDALVFPKLIAGYDDYKKSVPFLVPARRRSAARTPRKKA